MAVISLVLPALALAPIGARAAVYSEAVSGDISSNAQAPMAWTLDLGANSLSGTAGGNFFAGTSDFDLVSFTVPPGRQLDSITINTYLNIDPFSMSFLGLQAGTPWLDNLGWDIQGYYLMAWMHLESFMQGYDALTEMSEHAISPDYRQPLPSGVYTLLIEDVDTVMTYALTFNVSAIPEPGTALLLGLAAAAVRRASKKDSSGPRFC